MIQEMRSKYMKLHKVQASLLICLCCMFAIPARGQGQPGLPAPGNHSAEAGDCPKCKAGEFSTTVEKWVDHGDYVYVPDPPCSSSVSSDVQQIGRQLAD